MTDTKPPPVPCGSCPYRRDVPSGLWDVEEYAKLPGYDGEMVDQIEAGAIGLFMCHQQDGHICGGWLGCHGYHNLLAIRLDRNLDHASASVWRTDMPLFESGAKAAYHGIQDIENPGHAASKMIDTLLRKRLTLGSQ